MYNRAGTANGRGHRGRQRVRQALHGAPVGGQPEPRLQRLLQDLVQRPRPEMGLRRLQDLEE